MRPGDIEVVGDVTLYWLAKHKNDWRAGREREAVVLGPEAVRVLAPWLAAAKLKGDVPIFPSGKTGKQYTTGGYGQAVAGAFEKNPTLTRFCCYQLRHSFKRRVVRELGLDAARAAMRQSSIGTTAAYDSIRDMKMAAETARKIG